MHKSRQAVSRNTFSKIVLGLAAVLLLFAPPTARSGGAAEVYDFQSRSALLRPARRPGSRSRSKPQPAALRRSRRRNVRVRSFSVRRSPIWPEATCKVPASRRDRIQSGRLISPDRTFRRRSPTGCRRQHRRFFARSASVSEINWSTALASSAIRRLISTMRR